MNKKTEKTKIRLKKGDKVQVISGSDKGKQGKILAVNRESGRVIVEGINMQSKHTKAGKSRDKQQGGIIQQEGAIHASNVMYIHNGKPTRLGFKLTEVNGKKVKVRVCKKTGDVIKD